MGGAGKPHINVDMRVMSQRSDYSESYRLTYKHPPFFLVFISIFQFVTFLYYSLRSDEPLTLIGPVPFRSALIFNPYRRYEIWRYLTYMLIHAGYWHITFNIIVQLLVGIQLEVVHGFTPIFIIYTGGIIGGALGNSIADPNCFLAGASSGCYALIATHLSNLILNWAQLKNPCTKLLYMTIFCVADIGTAIYERHHRSLNFTYRTSYYGHLAGFVSGFLLGLVFLRNARILKWERSVARLAASVYLTLIFIAIFFNVLYQDYFLPSDTRELIWYNNPFGFDRE